MKSFYVYSHSISGKLFYIGSGSGNRSDTRYARNKKWLDFVRANPGEVEIDYLSYHGSRTAAYAAERIAIEKNSPIANTHNVGSSKDSHEVLVTVAIPRALRVLVKKYAKDTDLKFKVVFRLALEEYLSNRLQPTPAPERAEGGR